MKKVKIPIRTNPKTYFRTILEILSSFKPFNTLTGREKDVLSQLMYFNYLYENIPDSERYQIIFSKVTREKIMGNLKISRNHLDYAFGMLRKKDFITYNGINKKFLFDYKTDIEINFSEA